MPAGAAWQEAVPALARGDRRIYLQGLTPAAGAYVLAHEVFYKDLAFFASEIEATGGEPWSRLLLFPAHEILPFKELSFDTDVSCARLGAAYVAHTFREPWLVVAPAAALRQKLPPPESLQEALAYVVAGENLERESFLQTLLESGYERRPVVEERGEFSVRGGVIDLFPPLYDQPVRLEFWGDEVESLRFFDPASQRSQGSLEELLVLPASEVILDAPAREHALARRKRRQDPQFWQNVQLGRHFPRIERHIEDFYDQPRTLWDYLPADTVVVEWDPLNLAQDLRKLEEQAAAEPSGWLDEKPWEERRGGHATIFCPLLPWGMPEAAREFTFQVEKNEGLAQELARAGAEAGRLVPALAGRLEEWRRGGFHTILVCLSRHRAERLAQLLREENLDAAFTLTPSWEPGGEVEITVGELSGGFRLLASGLIVLTEDEAMGFRPERRRHKESKPPQFLTSLADLEEGDSIVHLDHGIGIYRGLVKLTVGAEVNDFLELEYQGGDRLYLPVDRLHLVQKYLGVDGVQPRIERLGGKSWEHIKKKVKKAVEKIARELVELYAARRVLPGHHFSPPDPVFREFEATFEYEETSDQLQAIQEVLADMTGEKPMDRLICGDVGYGKTEVALRAAFKAAMDGKQVAVLVPTTVLAEQHYDNFARRLAPYPLEVRVLSRFKSPAEQKRILADLAQGKVDIVIGTHRLVQKDVVFHDLGLVIVDEEQRFGVSQKEKMKEWRRTVDVLTLTATPIPRTLQLSLTGLRELSVINTAPENRRSIRTYLCHPEGAVIQAAIRRELARGGQVFFVHNRVRTLGTWTRQVQEMVPEARVAMAHGQMAERELERVMRRFSRGGVDVLMCTAIIEAGLDIPAANTIIINRAHTLGLAQLYQLRGRVGRSQTQAYAYLLVPGEAGLSTDAQKRLKALMEFTELGSGFKIALHDLQIRGAGNLLGQAQSGHLAEVGYELYLQLLEEAIREFKGEAREEPVPDPEIRIPVAAYLPEDYVPDIQQRLALYRRLSDRLSPEMVQELEEELLDRFGPLPPEGRNLLEVVRAKNQLRRLGIKRLDLQDTFAVLQFARPERLNLERLLSLLKKRPETFRLTPDQALRVRLPEAETPFMLLQNCLKEVETFVKA
ncbi:MAG: transcription-repair coupling factor [Deltaproteobacteria bacterium]|nr:transcription-repair coupling factor [Deltaproteobacteria bacterium]